MLRFFKSIIYLTLMICIYNCGTKVSDTKIPVSTKSAEADNLLHEALQLNSISKGDEAKKKLLKAIEIDENLFRAIIFLAFTYQVVGDSDEAIKLYKLSLKMFDATTSGQV